ncbi:hypothetical protein [Lewinella sp. 4G2]|uniref:hypothetical protein n=1 Tax=Lewinella sp. 4G2 TaxID=1803372 RepID=UPI0012F7F076|nr:hypothetical protein [Lewinella sp. 4G2]
MPSCTNPVAPETAEREQYIVISNDLGLRGGFIDQGNIITWEDAGITVTSAMDPNYVRKYALQDSLIVEGDAPSDYWSWQRKSAETITVYDPAAQNRHTLLQLRNYKPAVNLDSALRHAALRPLAAPERFALQKESVDYYVPMENGKGCVVNKSYRIGFLQRQVKDGVLNMGEDFYQLNEGKGQIYRVRNEFIQPILATEYGEANHRVLLIDSISTDPLTIIGRRVNTSSFGRPQEVALSALVTNTSQIISDLSDFQGQTSPLISTVKEKRSEWASVSFSGDEARRGIYLPDFETQELTLRLEGQNGYSILTPDRTIATGSLSAHPSAPVLRSGDTCDPNHYVTYVVSGDSLTLKFPLRVHLPMNMEKQVGSVSGNEAVMYTYEEFAATFVKNRAVELVQ